MQELLNLLEAHGKALCDFSSVWAGEVQTQDLLLSAPRTHHLRTTVIPKINIQATGGSVITLYH